MSADIVTMFGDKVACPYEPVKGTIETLEDLTERARCGDVKGIHAVIVYGDDSTGYTSTLMASYRALGTLWAMGTRLSTDLNAEEGK